MKKIILLLPLICGCDYIQKYTSNNPDVTALISEANTSFSDAEKEILGNSPTPKPSDETHPDPAKCVCKGTGIIKQGDGHETPCPYHAKKEPEPEPEPEVKVEPKPASTQSKVIYQQSPTGRIIRSN